LHKHITRVVFLGY